jgi:tRNA nucleotidyltransferase (CCA-adding enzyme)
MNTYLVGGAVRDKLLDYPVVEKDWLVVGATPQQMLEQGYQQVGKDFPVFLHPKSHEEYALARTERKSGAGYYGFDVYAAPDVSIEQDLLRRDLTINAMAMDQDGHIIDPYNGQLDLKNKVLRHISPAFAEDPLRVLRVARFAARYHHLGFCVADETLALMQQLAASDELQALAAERVCKETIRALGERSPHIYFQVLRDANALNYWFNEVGVLWGIPNPAEWHPEIDTGIHTLMVVEQSALLTQDPCSRFAALCHDLGKAKSPKANWPKHYGHEKRGVALVKKLCKRLKMPTEYEQLGQIASEFHLHIHRFDELKASTILKVLSRCDAFRKPQRFEQFLLVCEADFKGRTGFEQRSYPQRQYMQQAYQACLQVKPQDLIAQGFQGKALGEAINTQRVRQIEQLKIELQANSL